jgi:hypothetical protein
MIAVSEFHRLPDEVAWVRRSEPEIVIAGTVDEPLPGRVQVANAVPGDIDRLAGAASAYLESFVDRKRFAPASDWHLEWIEFGRTGDEPIGEFVAYFSLLDEDICGLWSVRFRYEDRFPHLFGVGFARRQR